MHRPQPKKGPSSTSLRRDRWAASQKPRCRWAEGQHRLGPVSFYVIKHPKGNVMFDTGNNDKTITDGEGWWGPLAKGFGLKMTKDDHPGPARQDRDEDGRHQICRRSATSISTRRQRLPVPEFDPGRAERRIKAAWWPDVGFSVYYIPGDFADTKKMKIVRLSGDFDCSATAACAFPRPRAHPGRQFTVVRLKNTGAVILTSDAVIKGEPRQEHDPADPGTETPGDAYKGYQKIRLIRDAENAKSSWPRPRDVQGDQTSPRFLRLRPGRPAAS